MDSSYTTWFKRMCEYGFVEGIDIKTRFPNLESEMHGGQNKVDNQLTIDMAKQFCMIQRTDIGKKFRQYFIRVEAAWDLREAVMARALQFANNQLELMKHQNAELNGTVAIQNQQISEIKPTSAVSRFTVFSVSI